MSGSCHRGTSPSVWLSNWAPGSSRTRAFQRPTPSRGSALRKVQQTITEHQKALPVSELVSWSGGGTDHPSSQHLLGSRRAALFCVLAVEHFDVLNICPEGEPMMSCEDCGDSATDESLLETKPIQSPLQVFAGMGGLALIAERLPMLYPDVIQQVRADAAVQLTTLLLSQKRKS